MTTIHTDRLIPRPFLPSDVAAHARIRANPDAIRCLPGGAALAVHANDIAARMMPRLIGLWTDPGYGPWAAIEAATGDLIGHLGLRLIYPDFSEVRVSSSFGARRHTNPARGIPSLRRSLDIPELQETELLYMLDPAAWGRGFATEGSRAALAHAFETPRLSSLIALVVPENRASLRVIAKPGFASRGIIDIAGPRCARFELTEPDWRANQPRTDG